MTVSQSVQVTDGDREVWHYFYRIEEKTYWCILLYTKSVCQYILLLIICTNQISLNLGLSL